MIDILEESGSLGGSLTLLTRSGEEKRDYLGLVQEARALGGGLAARGVGPNTRVGILSVPTMEFVLSLLATIAANACPVLLPAPPVVGANLWIDQIRALVRFAAVGLTLGPGTPAKDDVPHVQLSELDLHASSDSADGEGHDEGLILFTSGTTGNPRGVIMSRRAVTQRVVDDVGLRTYDPQHDLFLSWRSLNSSAGIFPGFLTPMGSGAPACVMETAIFSRTPESWLREISQRRATISGGPNFAFGAVAGKLAVGVPGRIDLSCWKVAECAGERIDARTIARFLQLAGPLGFDLASFVSLYALSEAGVVSFTREGVGMRTDEVDVERMSQGHAVPPSPGRTGVRIASSGTIRDGVSVAILDEQGRKLDARQVGEIAVRTPWLMLSYVDPPEATKQRLNDGWFRTGDTGYLAEGELYVTGRSKNVIIIRGRNYSGDDLERALQALDGIAPSSVAVIGRPSQITEELVVFAETDAAANHYPALSEIIRKTLWTDFGLSVRDVFLSEPGSLPRTSAGKLRREVLKSKLKEI